MRCMTIIAPGEIQEQLDVLKKEFYYAVLRSEMMRDQIGIQKKLRELNAGQETQAGKQ